MRAEICAALVSIIAVVGCTKGQGATPDTTQAAARASTTAATSPSDARHAIDSMDKKFADALTHGDTKTVVAMYSSDAIGDFPGAPVLNGSDALATAFEQDTSGATFKDVNLHTDDVLTGGDLAVENGTWSWTMVPKHGGKAEAQKGHYLTVWKHQPDGTWKMVRDYATSDPVGK